VDYLSDVFANRSKVRKRTIRVITRTVFVLLVLPTLCLVTNEAGATSSPSSTRPPYHSAISSEEKSGDQSLAGAWPISSRTAWVWTQDFNNLHGGPQAIDRTTDGGVTWSNVTPFGMVNQGGGHYIYGLFALSADDAWVTYDNADYAAPSTIAASFNGGRSWRIVGHTPRQGCTVQFVSREEGWCADNAGAAGSSLVTIYRTFDGGEVWHKVFENGDEYPMKKGSLPFECDKEMEFEPTGVGWAMFDCNGPIAPLYQTSDGGVTWVSRVANGPNHLVGEGATFDGVPVIEGSNGAVGCTLFPTSFVYVTNNGGRSFHVVMPPGKKRDWNIDVITPEKWKLVSGDRILSTRNGGRSWSTTIDDEHFNHGGGLSLQSPVSPSIHFVTYEVGWIINGFNSLLRTTDGGKTWTTLPIPGLTAS
jgi:photosystem II stability/assembly factor-like uncharacterized protein